MDVSRTRGAVDGRRVMRKRLTTLGGGHKRHTSSVRKDPIRSHAQPKPTSLSSPFKSLLFDTNEKDLYENPDDGNDNDDDDAGADAVENDVVKNVRTAFYSNGADNPFGLDGWRSFGVDSIVEVSFREPMHTL